ncbi:MAG: HetP family heterocyst commitment protein [Oculatellaceae cyanobacterium Prado106]|jgi:hypothetical protein|nr:HetP family heterocyst commitment protein [Oculatellaceae cyanobacterium Prado106]
MTSEQFTRVVDAILNGKYSWACVLILQFTGYNPLHYIPYRTYNRLMKENIHRSKNSSNSNYHRDGSIELIRSTIPSGCLSQLDDLGHLDPLPRENTKVRGGFSQSFSYFFSKQH